MPRFVSQNHVRKFLIARPTGRGATPQPSTTSPSLALKLCTRRACNNICSPSATPGPHSSAIALSAARRQRTDSPMVRRLYGGVQEVGEYDERPRNRQGPVHVSRQRHGPCFVAQQGAEGSHLSGNWVV